ncbi:hypothetical protein [Actinokineospora sp.]|uniref:hypothetical protein n=1 Tax=Actinokineospora sp. TaxID=1872133 RepID=UPI003D6A2649
MTGFNVDLAALDQAGQAISQTMHDMKTRAVDRIDGGSGQYGHDGSPRAPGSANPHVEIRDENGQRTDADGTR